MADVIPLQPELLAYEVRVSLGGPLVLVGLEWRVRAKAWYLDVHTVAGEPLLIGRRVVADWPLNSRQLPTDYIPCLLVASRQGASEAPAGLTELGREVLLLALREEDLPP